MKAEDNANPTKVPAQWFFLIPQSSALIPASFQARSRALDDRLHYFRPHGGIAHAQFLFAVDEHSRLEQQRGDAGSLQHRKIIEIVHAVLLVGERSVLAHDRVGMVARMDEASLSQRQADGGSASEAGL